MVIVVSGEAIRVSPAARRNVTSIYAGTPLVPKPVSVGSDDWLMLGGGRAVPKQGSLWWDAWREGWRRQEPGSASLPSGCL